MNKKFANRIRTTTQSLTSTAADLDISFLENYSNIIRLVLRPANVSSEVLFAGRDGDTFVPIGDELELDIDYLAVPTTKRPQVKVSSGSADLIVIAFVKGIGNP